MQGVLLATSGLRLPDGDEPVSQLAGAFASVQTAARLVFTLDQEVSRACYLAFCWHQLMIVCLRSLTHWSSAGGLIKLGARLHPELRG